MIALGNLLLTKGADLSEADAAGNTMLYLAARSP